MQQYAIMGVGTFGYFLAKFLAEGGFPVLAIDTDEENVERVKPFVSRAVIADATDKETLLSLGIADSDVTVVTFSRNMEASILCALHLKDLGAKNVYVRAASEDHRRILEIIGVQVIFPERDTARRVAYGLSQRNILDQLPLAEGYSIIEFAPPQSFMGKTLRQLALKLKFNVLIVAVKERIPENLIIAPGADFVVKDSDTLVALGRNEDLNAIQAL